MRKLINLSAFVLAILIIVFMLIPTKTVDRNASVYVEHEWDTLENVILGSPKMLAVPQIHKSVLGYGYIVKNEKIMKEAPGKPIQQVNPFVFSNILTESDTVAKILKDKSIHTGSEDSKTKKPAWGNKNHLWRGSILPGKVERRGGKDTQSIWLRNMF